MMTFKIFKISEIDLLQDAWLQLEKGLDMTYFQSYAWNLMLARLNEGVRSKKFVLCYATVYRGDKICLIAPLWIVRKTFGKFNQRGIYLFGRGQWSDYLNFIYNDWDDELAVFLFQKIKETFKIDTCYFENLQETSSLKQFITDYFQVVEQNQSVCVALSLPNTKAEYTRLLSKNARQNLRTARNRADKDGLEFVYNFNDTQVNLSEFSKFRSVRVAEKNNWEGNTFKWRILNFVSTKILKRGWYKFREYNPFEDDRRSRFLTLKTLQGDLCAAFNYGIDAPHQRIVMMAVATNEDYARYSPGMLLLHAFIEALIDSKSVETVDFTRGNERYKYVLGGTEHLINAIEFKI